MAAPLLVSLTSASKRSRIVAGLTFATFFIFLISRLPEPGALLFGRPRPLQPLPNSQGPPAYDGPRFELFDIRDFADEVEITTLHIKVKEEPTPLAPPSKGSPGLARPNQKPSWASQSPSTPNGHLIARDTDAVDPNAPPPIQRKLPIALPKLVKHRLDAPEFNLSTFDEPIPGVPPAIINLEFPRKKFQPDASNIIFGVATMLERMPETLRNIQHWGAHTNARFVVVHEPQNVTLRPGEPSAEEMTRLYREAGIDHVTLIEKDAGWGERFVSLLGTLHAHMEEQIEWAVLMDDDTFFFDLDAVLKMLSKYDPSQPWYVGALSDNKWNINNGGLYAVGGAGVFLSRAMMATMAPYADSCFPKEGTEMGGDTLVGQCIHTHTLTKITLEHGLHQLDLHGDVTGFYEAPRPQPLSVHHWKSWHHHDIPAVATVAHACGRSCVLRNFVFADGWVMSNGFSIIKHGYNATELATQHPYAMERTWKETIWEVEDSWRYSLAPLKKRDEDKVQFLMERSVVGMDGSVTVYYVRREEGVGRGLIRIIWR